MTFIISSQELACSKQKNIMKNVVSIFKQVDKNDFLFY